MKIMIVNSKINTFGSDKKSSSWFHSFLCYYIYEKVSVTTAQSTTQNTLYITWGVNWKIFCDKQFTTVTLHKNVQNYYNEKCTYNVNTH